MPKDKFTPKEIEQMQHDIIFVSHKLVGVAGILQQELALLQGLRSVREIVDSPDYAQFMKLQAALNTVVNFNKKIKEFTKERKWPMLFKIINVFRNILGKRTTEEKTVEAMLAAIDMIKLPVAKISVDLSKEDMGKHLEALDPIHEKYKDQPQFKAKLEGTKKSNAAMKSRLDALEEKRAKLEAAKAEFNRKNPQVSRDKLREDTTQRFAEREGMRRTPARPDRRAREI